MGMFSNLYHLSSVMKKSPINDKKGRMGIVFKEFLQSTRIANRKMILRSEDQRFSTRKKRELEIGQKLFSKLKSSC